MIELTLDYQAEKVLRYHQYECRMKKPAPAVLFSVKEDLGEGVFFMLAHGNTDGQVLTKKGWKRPEDILPLIREQCPTVLELYLVCCHPEAFQEVLLDGVTVRHISGEVDTLPQEGLLHTAVFETCGGDIIININ